MDLFFYKGSINIENLVEENEKAIEFLRSNMSEKSDSENNNKLYELSRINDNLYRIKEYVKSQVIIVNGDGGTGKTHLLTKMCNDLIYKDVPTIIFYGQTIYKFEEYIKYIEQKMKIDDLFTEIANVSKKNNETGTEYWNARELSEVLEYV